MFPLGGRREVGPAAESVAWTALLGGLATVAVAAIPVVHLVYRAPGVHVALETANGLIAALVSYLLYGRFRETRGLQELLLVLALATVAVANLLLTAVPSALALGHGPASGGSAALGVRLIGTLLLGAAALAPTRQFLEKGTTWHVVLPLAVAVVVAAAVGWAWPGPPSPVGDLTGPVLTGHPVLLTTNALSTVVYAMAAWRFARRARRSDHLLRWLARGCVLGAFAAAHYVFYPSLYSDYVYSGDVLRLGMYACLLVGAAREISRYFELVTQMAVLAARRRIARDLHDGLAQELSYLWSQSQALVAAGTGGSEQVERIAGAAGRALDEARRAIASLTRPLDEPFHRVLQQTAEDLASRYGVAVTTDLDPAAPVGEAAREALLRIAAEAVRNAVRHGCASRVDVTVTARPLCMVVRDDGRGFFPGRTGAVRAGGFGLTSMRERAEGVGARFTVMSAPGEGTTVRVEWP